MHLFFLLIFNLFAIYVWWEILLAEVKRPNFISGLTSVAYVDISLIFSFNWYFGPLPKWHLAYLDLNREMWSLHCGWAEWLMYNIQRDMWWQLPQQCFSSFGAKFVASETLNKVLLRSFEKLVAQFCHNHRHWTNSLAYIVMTFWWKISEKGKTNRSLNGLEGKTVNRAFSSSTIFALLV